MSSVDEPGAVPIYTDEHFPGRFGYKPRWVIVHGTAGFNNPEDVAHYFQHVQASTNYIIGRNGEVVENVHEIDGAYGNGIVTGTPGHAVLGADGDSDGVHRDFWWSNSINPNYLTISIEHVKPHDDNSDEITPAQEAASFKLIHDICQRWSIPMRPADQNGGVTGHYSIQAIGRSRCPGPYPWARLWAYLKDGGTTMIDVHNTDLLNYYDLQADGSLKCKSTGHIVQKGILAFYLRYGGDALNGLTYLGLPLSNETGVGGKTNCVTQQFERGLVAWDPQHQLDAPPSAGDVYLLHQPQFTAQPPTPTPAPDSNLQHYKDILAQIEQLAKV